MHFVLCITRNGSQEITMGRVCPYGPCMGAAPTFEVTWPPSGQGLRPFEILLKIPYTLLYAFLTLFEVVVN